VYLARKTLFKHPLFAWLIRSLKAVPIDQESVGKEGLRIALDQLGEEKAVLVFPEGSRTPDGRVHELRPVVHLLIKRTRAPVLPVGVAGIYEAWPIWRRYPVLAPLFWPAGKATMAACVGEPLDGARLAELPREEALAVMHSEITRLHQRAEHIRRK
jgi:1-acyl-sn-glycerol-3-phosphate acyltransferase